MKKDFNGDGKSSVLISSPWGIGILTLSNNTLIPEVMNPNYTFLGSWQLNTKENSFDPIGDFDGDGKDEIMVSSSWGIGILKQIGNGIITSAIAQNGTRLNGWLLNTQDNNLGKSGDFDGDGKEEIIVTSSWGLGILKNTNNTIKSLTLVPNGTRLGEWLLNTNTDYFNVVGDFDGDGKVEILASSPWGIGILKFENNSLTSMLMAQNGTRIGDFILDTATQKIGITGDFDGDKKIEILIKDNNKIAIIKIHNNQLSLITNVKSGQSIGNWLLNSKENDFIYAADFDGDGKDEMLTSSAQGIALLKLNEDSLLSLITVQNGNRMGEWLLDTNNNRMNYVADFDNDKKHEILISSPWGIGILKYVNNRIISIAMHPNGIRLGNWLLNTSDNNLELGQEKSYALLVYHNDWQDLVERTEKSLRKRGYNVFSISDGTAGLEKLRQLTNHTFSGDRVFVYLAGHGSDPRENRSGTVDNETSKNHFFQFQSGGNIYLYQFAPLFKKLADQGVDLIVLDGSCNGGETVNYAFDEKYCAMSTTSVQSPGLTNTPDHVQVIEKFGKPSKYGHWNTNTYAASLMSGAIIKSIPVRFAQRWYRNDNTPIARISMFYRIGIDFLKIVDNGGWDLRYKNCRVFPVIYKNTEPPLSASERDNYIKNGISVKNFLDIMKAIIEPQQEFVRQLKVMLTDENLISRASSIYASHDQLAWQTTLDDTSWIPFIEPSKYSGITKISSIASYQGSSGFKKLIMDILTNLSDIENCYKSHQSLLVNIESLSISAGIIPAISIASTLMKPKETHITDYIELNKHEKNMLVKYDFIRNKALINNNMSILYAPANPSNTMTLAHLNDINRLSGFLLEPGYTNQQLNHAIAQFKATSVKQQELLIKTNFILAIAEDSISMAQNKKANPGDIISW